MTDNSFDFDAVDTFAAGAVGEPGARVFYFQVVVGTTVVSLRAEKQQVSLLADYLERLIGTVEFAEGPPAHMPELVDPVLEEWTVGSMMVAVNTVSERIVIVATELGDDDDADESDLASARAALTIGQVEAYIEGARRLVAAGRPPCPWCGRPEDRDGHACPRMN